MDSLPGFYDARGAIAETCLEALGLDDWNIDETTVIVNAFPNRSVSIADEGVTVFLEHDVTVGSAREFIPEAFRVAHNASQQPPIRLCGASLATTYAAASLEEAASALLGPHHFSGRLLGESAHEINEASSRFSMSVDNDDVVVDLVAATGESISEMSLFIADDQERFPSASLVADVTVSREIQGESFAAALASWEQVVGRVESVMGLLSECFIGG